MENKTNEGAVNTVTADNGADKNTGDNGNGKKNRIKKKYVLIAIIVVLIIGTIFELHNIEFSFSHVSTSDAFVDGSSAIVPVAPQVKGKVVKVYVKENQFIKKGQPLFKIDQSDYIQDVNRSLAGFKASKKQIKQISISILVQNSA